MTRENKLVRLTFSKPVAELCSRYVDGSKVERLKVKRGRKLDPGQKSETGVYLLCTALCGSPLRAQLDSGFSAAYFDPEYRHIYEGHLGR